LIIRFRPVNRTAPVIPRALLMGACSATPILCRSDDVLVRSPADLPELPRHLPDFGSIKTPPSDFELVLREEVLEPLVEHDVLDRQIQSAAIDKPLEPEMEIGAAGWVTSLFKALTPPSIPTMASNSLAHTRTRGSLGRP
jgi:hypothetical protein